MEFKSSIRWMFILKFIKCAWYPPFMCTLLHIPSPFESTPLLHVDHIPSKDWSFSLFPTYRNTEACSSLGERIFGLKKIKIASQKIEFLNFCFLAKKKSVKLTLNGSKLTKYYKNYFFVFYFIFIAIFGQICCGTTVSSFVWMGLLENIHLLNIMQST